MNIVEVHNFNYKGNQLHGYVVGDVSYLNWYDFYKLLGYNNLLKIFKLVNKDDRKTLTPNDKNKELYKGMWPSFKSKRIGYLIKLGAAINLAKDYDLRKYMLSKIGAVMEPKVWTKERQKEELHKPLPIRLLSNNTVLGATIRCLDIEGEPWFVASEVAKVLNYDEVSSVVFNYVSKSDYLMLRHNSYYNTWADCLWTDKYDYRSIILIDLAGFGSLLHHSPLAGEKINQVKKFLNENFATTYRINTKTKTIKVKNKKQEVEPVKHIEKKISKQSFSEGHSSKPEDNVITPLNVEIKDGKQVISARELYKRLGVKHRFSEWALINFRYFTDKYDYVAIESKVTGGNGAVIPIQDYAITIDMAKQLCMMSKTTTGKKYREYFIDLEKKWNDKQELAKHEAQLTGNVPVNNDLVVNLTKQTSLLIKQNQELTEQLVKNNQFMQDMLVGKNVQSDSSNTTYVEHKQYNNNLLSMAQFTDNWNESHLKKINRNKLFELLRSKKVLKNTRSIDRNTPVDSFKDKGYFVVRESVRGNENVYTTLLTESGAKYISYLVNQNLDYFG